MPKPRHSAHSAYPNRHVAPPTINQVSEARTQHYPVHRCNPITGYAGSVYGPPKRMFTSPQSENGAQEVVTTGLNQTWYSALPQVVPMAPPTIAGMIW